MPVATTTEAGRQVLTPAAEKILNDRERARQAAAKRAGVLTPLFSDGEPTIGKVPLATLPEPPARAAPAAEPKKPARSVTLATTISYRDYDVTITATGMLLDEFCDMLDKRLGVVNS